MLLRGLDAVVMSYRLSQMLLRGLDAVVMDPLN
jgi:hypothetical protein